ncbi:acyl-CoA thioesterase [Rhodococcus sp. HNM0569]|uniref:acyl-CoA thioesterase n=1 Tax=Rhodococcus sp. HNM0569 TaxID=2716340 RepID=UPI003211F6FC
MAPFTATVQVRWGDSDRLGHVNNTMFLEYMQEARVQFLEYMAGQLGTAGAGGPFVVRRMDLEFLRPITDSSGPLAIEITVLHVGTSSYTLHHVIKDRDGAVCGSGDGVLVAFDLRTQGKRPLSDEELHVLRGHLVEAA